MANYYKKERERERERENYTLVKQKTFPIHLAKTHIPPPRLPATHTCTVPANLSPELFENH